MKYKITAPFEKDYAKLPVEIKTKFKKQLTLLLTDPAHPSLRLKKMKGHKNRWEVSITFAYRFTFELMEDCYILRRIGPHDILRKP